MCIGEAKWRCRSILQLHLDELHFSQPSENTAVYIVDKDPEVVTHYEKVLPKLRVQGKFAGGTDDVSEFVCKYLDLPPT